jgi:CheY-like chemotaxis protein
LQSIGTLAGGIAHDFNNVLAIILGYTAFLEIAAIPPEKKAQAIVVIKNAVQRGAALVRQILTFARKSEVLFEPMNLADLLHELISMLQETFPKIITFKEVIEKELPLISADRTQMHQALLNLCVNARDAMPNGGCITFTMEKKTGEELRERFPAAELESYLCLAVADTGEGMTDATRSKIFDPFFTTKEKGKGTGLGLSVVFGVVQAHHGFIDVESVVGRGTTFRLYFPFSLQDKTKHAAQKQEDLIESGGTETILLVEDEESLIEMARLTLESHGYHVYAAQDGPKAVEMYRIHHNEIALVVSDIGLPGMTGIDVFKTLKEMNPNVKLVFVSGFIEPDVKSRLLGAGAKGFIQKPYTPREILQGLRAVLDEKGL